MHHPTKSPHRSPRCGLIAYKRKAYFAYSRMSTRGARFIYRWMAEHLDFG
ncbi:MAG: DUF768 domain-containing protein [Mesorhizobium sp.]|nr:MAG: DUF768 domain-containing protein [Mesorhizobium sp.]